MAFENVTLFEVHVDGEAVGSSLGGVVDAVVGDEEYVEESVDAAYSEAADVEDAVTDDEAVAADTPRGRGKGQYLVVAALVAAGTLALRARRRRGARADVVVEHDGHESAEETGVEVDYDDSVADATVGETVDPADH